MGTISVKGLGKAYKRYHSHWARLAEWVLPSKPRHDMKWVLKDISFEVSQGEALGVIGINGAGKSTLLKLITGTIQPTLGSVTIGGRVAALLELGMGFHPDFTGRQNAYMAGQLLGMDVNEITHLMPDIEAFAEIGDYIDRPVRIYSSGMQMRLAFSVATAKRPDVLIVDEALSVGDVYFQHKSFDRIRDFNRQGTTLLIVSHDKTAIQSVCNRAILLDGGRLAKHGAPEEIMDYYNAMLAERENNTVRVEQHAATGKVQTVSGTGEATFTDIALLDKNGERVEVVDAGSDVILQVRVKANQPIPHLVLGFLIKDRLGQPMYGTNTALKNMPLHDVGAGEDLVYRFAFPVNLGPGSYSVTTALSSTETHLVNNYEWRDLALVFSVVNLSREHFDGCVLLEPQISIDRQPQAVHSATR
jgi:lipopolysaccharide transport system ATP-binding protein